MHLYKNLTKYAFPLLCLALFILRLPPVLPPFIQSDFVSSHSIARYIITVLFFHTAFGMVTGRRPIKLWPPVVAAILAYYITQSLSVVDAVNISAFLGRYKTVLFALMFFVAGSAIVDTRQRVQMLLWVLAASVIVNVAIEAVIYFQVPFLFSAFKSLVNDSYFQDLTVNMDRDRYFVTSFDAALIPLMFYLFFQTKRLSLRIGLAALTALIVIFCLLSNFRTQLLVALLMTGASVILFIRQYWKTGFVMAGMAGLFLLIYLSLTQAGNFNALDRIISPDNLDYITVSDRFHYWGKSIDFGREHPLFGIGLGNFLDHLTEVKPVRTSASDPKNLLMKITWVHPHNVFFGLFAETGFPGLMAFLFLLGCFLTEDFWILRKGSRLEKALAISFWGLFSFSLVNPATTLDYAVLFWIMRVMITATRRPDTI